MTIAKKVEEFEEKMRDYQNFVDQFEVMDKYQDDTEMYRKALERDRAIIGEKWKGILTWLETSLREVEEEAKLEMIPSLEKAYQNGYDACKQGKPRVSLSPHNHS